MDYAYWDWSQFVSVGNPNGGSGINMFEPDRYDPIIVNETDSGFPESSPEYSHGIWIFRFEFIRLTPAGYRYAVDFFNTHRGGLPFYFYWPWELADAPDPPEPIPGGLSPWNTEIDLGAGMSPVCLVKRLQNNFPVRRHPTKNNYFYTSQPIEFRQV